MTETFEMLADLPWYLRVAERVFMGVKDRKAERRRHCSLAASAASRDADTGRT